MSTRVFRHRQEGLVYTWNGVTQTWHDTRGVSWSLTTAKFEKWLHEVWWSSSWEELTDLTLDEGL